MIRDLLVLLRRLTFRIRETVRPAVDTMWGILVGLGLKIREQAGLAIEAARNKATQGETTQSETVQGSAVRSTTKTSMLKRTLAQELWPAEGEAIFRRDAALVVFGVTFLVVCSRLEIVSAFGAVLLGVFYGMRLATISGLLYAALAIMGLPVISPDILFGSGWLGQSYAYYLRTMVDAEYIRTLYGWHLLGTVLAACVGGWYIDRSGPKSTLGTIVAMLLGITAYYMVTLPWVQVIAYRLLGASMFSLEREMRELVVDELSPWPRLWVDIIVLVVAGMAIGLRRQRVQKRESAKPE